MDLKKMQKDSSLAPATISKFSRDEVDLAQEPLTRRSLPRTSRVVTTRVHPAVLAAALQAAGGDASRLVIESPTSVYVR